MASSYLLSQLDNLYSSSVSLASTTSWTPLVRISRAAVTSLFKRLQVGELEVRTREGVWRFGDPTLVRAKANNAPTHSAGVKPAPFGEKPTIRASMDVKNDAFWVRMFVGADLGFAEAFMCGDVETPDLGACFQVSPPRFAHRARVARVAHSLCIFFIRAPPPPDVHPQPRSRGRTFGRSTLVRY